MNNSETLVEYYCQCAGEEGDLSDVSFLVRDDRILVTWKSEPTAKYCIIRSEVSAYDWSEMLRVVDKYSQE